MAIDDEGIAQIIHAFARAVVDPAEWMPALAAMSDALGSASSSLELADLHTGVASINCTHPLAPDLVEHYEQRIYHINPRVARARKKPVGVLIDDRDLLVEGDPNMAEFLDWLEKTPNRYVQGVKLFEGNGHEIYFGSYFSGAQGPPEAWHRDVHRVVIPHLINFIAVGRALSANKLQNDIVEIENLSSERSFALLDRSGRIVECSSGFERRLNDGALLAVHQRRLVAKHASHRSKVETFIRSAVVGGINLKPPFPVRLADCEHPHGVILRAIPLQQSFTVFDILRPAALITLTNLDPERQVDRREIAALFDLTPREADVAALLGGGYSVESASRQLGISTFTVRQHLKATFGKLNVSRQSELASMIARLF